MKITATILTYLLIGLSTSFGWLLFLTSENFDQQLFALIFTIIVFVFFSTAYFFLKKQRPPSSPINFTVIPIISSLTLIIFFLWNLNFISYNELHEYSSNIFRGAFNGFISPLYGKVYPDKSFDFFAEVLLIILILWSLAFLLKKERESRIIYLVTFIVFGISIVFFAFHSSIYETFLSNNCHYLSFKSDNSKFDSFSDILKNYTPQMKEMSIHNNHYPPGNVMLSYVDEKFFPFFLKATTFLSLLISLFPFIAILKYYKVNYYNLIFAIFLFITSGSVLFFQGIALSPIVIPISLTLFYLLIH